MRHLFKIHKPQEDALIIGQLNDNNQINGLGMHYNYEGPAILGKFKDGKPSGIYVQRILNSKKEETICIETDPTKKCRGCFQLLSSKNKIIIYVFDDGNKEEKLPYTIEIEKYSWSVTKKGSKHFDVKYVTGKSKNDNHIYQINDPKVERKFVRYFPNKAAMLKNAKHLKWTNFDPWLFNFSILDFPIGIQFEDKRKSLLAKGIGPCCEYDKHIMKLYFIDGNTKCGLGWLENGKEHKGIVKISQYRKGRIEIDKSTNILTIDVNAYSTIGVYSGSPLHSTKMIIDPNECSFVIKHMYESFHKAKVDKDAKVKFWYNVDPKDENTFGYEGTY